MNITVNVDNVTLDSVIGEQSRYDEDGDYVGTSKTLADLVAAHIAADIKRSPEYPGIRERATELRDAEIREQVRPIVAAAIESPVQRTNSYGRPVGEPTTLEELIVEEAKALLNKRSDDYRGNGETALQRVVREAVDKAIRTELAAAIADEKAKVVAAVRAKAAELIAEAVKQGIGR